MKIAGGKLVIASHNAGKVREIGALLSPFAIQAVSAGELGISEPEETGTTFVENAELKARHSMEASNLPALADDSGLVIPALGGDPGVYSARWAGAGKDFSVAFSRIERELAAKNISGKVAAYFACVLSLCLPDGKIHSFEGRVDGTITFPPSGGAGFGYDPIFTPDGYDVTFAGMDANIKNSISHRAHAFEQFVSFLEKNT
ncbi:MAG: RdgB/HAM1 family non-canonical purine NTP pyrophosphatase [Alphaproteobacteria bacterium]|nr:RdgB/HAM1 family non-canonical purine NTP pyrophosphatase [Alphaproteobacteria bacterium]